MKLHTNVASLPILSTKPSLSLTLEIRSFFSCQGEVEQVALMKPKALSEHDDGMLEFLEDIIGTSSFKEPIEELAKKLEELGEVRGEKVIKIL